MYTSLILVVIGVVVFIVQVLVSGFTDLFLLDSSMVLNRPWIFITSIFLHGDIIHLFYNMFGLALFGTILESVIGKKRFLGVFFVGGLLASVGAVFFYDKALGASGALFAVLGTLAVLRPHLQVWINFIPLPMYIATIVWAAIDIFGLFLPTGVANLAHLVGLAFGLVMGGYWRSSFRLFNREPKKLDLDENVIDEWEDRWIRGR